MVLSKLFVFPVFLLFFLRTSINADVCQHVSCGDIRVDFPFRVGGQPDCCGNPGFNLSCRNQSQTTITFPLSGEFNVDIIGYFSTNLLISDPENCVGKRLFEGFDLSGTPFEPRYPESYLFLNCSSHASADYPALHFSCLSGTNFSVWAIPPIAYNQSSLLRSCREIATILVPLSTIGWPEYYLDDFMLTWKEPDCSSSCNDRENQVRINCESDGGCSDDNIQKKSGLLSGTKFALIFILGTPILLIVVVIIHLCNGQPHQSTVEISRLAAEPQLPASTVSGLDGSSIEAYPITLLGESRRLPRPNDNTCSICLSEYHAKETIRTIPDCDHYFHADCIDKWLRLNAACPVCRNMPDQKSALIIHPTDSSSSPPPP